MGMKEGHIHGHRVEYDSYSERGARFLEYEMDKEAAEQLFDEAKANRKAMFEDRDGRDYDFVCTGASG